MKVGHTVEDDSTRAASIMAKLNHQRTQVHFCDCVIRKGQGQVYAVHRCVLAASSPVLASILQSSGVLVELKAPCLSDSILGLLLDYIYTGTLPHLDNKQCLYLISAAQYLKMTELQNTLRTRVSHPLEYNNTCDVATTSSLLPSWTDGEESPLDSLHSGCTSQSKNLQSDIQWTHLSVGAGSKSFALSDGICLKNETNASSNYRMLNTDISVHNCGISETTQTSHRLIQSIRGCDETQQMSTMCQSKKKNLSAGALKPDIWQERETSSYSSDSTETEENNQIHDEETRGFSLGEIEEKYPIAQVESHDSYCSVIRYSSRVTRKHEGNASKKLRQDRETETGKKSLTEKSYRDIAEQSQLNDHAYCVHFNLIQNNELMQNKYIEIDSKKEYDKNHDFGKLAQTQDMPRVITLNTAMYSQEENNVTQLQSATFQDERICAKRKSKEELSEQCSKSAKTHLADSAATVANNCSVYNYKQDKDTLNTMLNSVSAPPEVNTYSFPVLTYSGHVFYHCEPQTVRSSSPSPLAPDFSHSLPDPPTEVPILSNFRNENATLSEGQVVLLDISCKSSEMLVSHKETSEMETYQDHNKVKTDNETSQNGEGDCQGDNDGQRAQCHEGAKIITTSLTSCASVCDKDCVHNSVSASGSDHIPSSGMQTNVSDHPPSLVQHAFQCSLCERSFSQRGSLNRHVRSHLGVRPFPCPHCPMTFSRQYRVIEHMRVHQRSTLGMDFPKPPASSV